LKGKALPDLSGLDEGLAGLDLTGKSVLVCFWDMEQRPSRRGLIQLARQAESLKEKGAAVIAVQASPVERSALDAWMKENEIPFTRAMIQADPDKVRFAWGVKSLPWLILTDAQHVVRAEGFGVEELDSLIAGEKK